MNKRFNKMSGFSLLQVMVAGAIMIMVALGISQLINRVAKDSKLYTSKSGQLSLAQELRAIISNSSLCKKALGGATLNPTGDTNLSLKLPGAAGKEVVVVGGADLLAYGLHVRKFYAANAEPAGTAVNHNRLIKTSLQLEANVVKAAGSGAEETANQFKSIPVGTFISEISSGDVILDCYSLEKETDLRQSACDSIPGAIYDPVNFTCKLPAANTVCPPGHFVTSLVNNVVTCAAPPTVRDTSCPSGQYIASIINNVPTCSAPPAPPPGPTYCPANTYGSCVVSQAQTGDSSGTCNTGAGTCNYRCGAGGWQPVTNGCVAADKSFDLYSPNGCTRGYCTGSIGYQCGSRSQPAADGQCTYRGFKRAASFGTAPGPKSSQCGDPQGNSCFQNQNPGCNLVLTTVNCTNL